MAQKLGIYIHIPFCRSKCDYCDFYSLAGQEERMNDYQKAVIRHLRETSPLSRSCQVDSIYFGGGTPSFYGDKRLRELLGEIRKRFEVSRDVEISVECNPDSVDKRFFSRLRGAGVNRISLGVQSACNQDLINLHRPHTFQQAEQAVSAARVANLKNISLDLIYGLPGQTLEGWQETVERAISLAPEHLSCYGLKVEAGTPLYRRVQQGELLPDDDAQADLYLWTVDRLAQAGYRQYEISNFARPGRQSRHNLKYWMGHPYVGFGPGAHSDFGGRRYSFVRDLEAYISGVLDGGTIIDESDLIPQRERGGEYLMLRLRTTRGVEEWEYRREFFLSFDPLEQKLSEYETHGWAEHHDRRWNFTPQGFLISNQLIGALLEIQESSTAESTTPRLRQPNVIMLPGDILAE